MKLPNGERAFLDERKLASYCLDPTHPRGRHKARVFAAALGFSESATPILRMALLEAARESEALPAAVDEHGARYTIDFPMAGPRRSARVRSVWMVRHGEDFPRLISCYILGE